MDLTVHIGFANTARDQLRVLGAKIKNEDHSTL
jgi:hypothetical protein